jgi:hypothetical protein
MRLHTYGDVAAPLSFTLRGGNYVGRGVFRNYVVDGNAEAITAVRPPPDVTLDGTLCLRNDGRRRIGLVGSQEAENASLPETRVGGQVSPVDPALTFLGAHPRSLLDRAGTVLGRASQFTGGVAPPWLLWALAVVLVVGVPLATAAALFLALRANR